MYSTAASEQESLNVIAYLKQFDVAVRLCASSKLYKFPPLTAMNNKYWQIPNNIKWKKYSTGTQIHVHIKS